MHTPRLPGQIGTITGRSVLITGASSGIGLAAARVLASRGAHVTLVGRNPDKTHGAADDVRALAKGDVHVEICDLASMADMRGFCARLRDSRESLDVLLNNAGAVHTSRKRTADGIEMTFGVNHLGYMLPTLGLLPLLQAAPAARIVNVASMAHRAANIDLDDLQLESAGYSGWTAYANSKAHNILFTRELARRLQGTMITANSLHPGVVGTGFGKNDKGWFSWLWALGTPFLRSPDAGAETSIHLCSAPELDGVTGRYFSDCREAKPRPVASDDHLAAGLWSRSAAMMGLSDEGLPIP